MENERRFTADAAHELRTPLAALRAQAQVARGAGDDGERRRALDNVIAGCDRAAHLIDQLLTLARLEPESFQAQREPCDLREIARLAVAELAPTAHGEGGSRSTLRTARPTTVPETRGCSRILLRNLARQRRALQPARIRRSTFASEKATAARS